ncbi:conserved hypothetical protein (plasmid) [Bacillus cereus Q1]|uniref:HEPN domain-containing protein n=1 Tax=Bacillus cereus (strain Q1) TaxID=361100 RepID=B9J6H0_BACCQ|nr:hypothetical protein [Bacillus paranthracis]ACM15965.1 conserved hypothetical protein [Bacillus cereus Q1]
MGKIFEKEFRYGKNMARIGWEEHVESELPVSGLRQFGYIAGYKDAADELVEQYEYNEAFVYPIMFMYRQYLELLLKNLNTQLINPVDFSGHLHDIKYIWNKMFPQVKDQLELKKSPLNHIRDIVYAFASIDPKSSNFRYFWGYGNKPTLKGKISIDLQKLKEDIDKVDSILYDTYGM